MFNERILKAIRGALFMRRNGLKETDEAYRDCTEAMATIDELLAGNAITNVWTIEDIHAMATGEIYDHDDKTDLTDEQCRQVLRDLEDGFDADTGISWPVIDDLVDEVKRNA